MQATTCTSSPPRSSCDQREPARRHLRRGRLGGPHGGRRAHSTARSAGVRIARDKAEDGSIDYIVNPTFEEAEASDLELTIAGTAEYISMVEAGADEVSEDRHAAPHIEFRPGGHRRVLRRAADSFLDKVHDRAHDLRARPSTSAEPVDMVERDTTRPSTRCPRPLRTPTSSPACAKVEELKAAASRTILHRGGARRCGVATSPRPCKALEKRAMRAMIIETGERVDGRATDEIRPLLHRAATTCRASTAPACSSAARPRSSPSSRSACSTSGSASTPSTRPRASATCTSTTSRRTAPARPAAWALRSAARSATAPWPSARLCR